MSDIKQDLRELLGAVCNITENERFDVYLVGGFVRDCLLHKETWDIDIAVPGDALELAQKIAPGLHGKYVLLDESKRIARIVIKKEKSQAYLDLSSYKGTIDADLGRRDFSINAMAINLKTFLTGAGEIIDPFHGREDLRKGCIKAISPGVFREDPSRLLRAVRFAFKLNYKISRSTENQILKDSHLIKDVPGEKAREELLYLINLPNAGPAFRYMDKVKLLSGLIPEIESMKGVEQPREHYWDVFNHSLETIGAIEFLLMENDWRYNIGHLQSHSQWAGKLVEHFNKKVSSGSTRKQILKLAGLLHDIAKPITRKIDENGRTRFLNHAALGADMAVEILKRLRFSNKERLMAKMLIQQHLRPFQLAHDKLPTGRAVYRFFRDTEGYGIDILFIALADYLAARGGNIETQDWAGANTMLEYIYNEHKKQQRENLKQKLINGHDLMYALGLGEGPLIGKLLLEIDEAQATGKIKNKMEAIEFVEGKLNRHSRLTREHN
ncbi:MAG TPA: HD domain-containing protein [Dehalococcoidia bacterium]|nr:HD domain-containing protein [Dehalococcoidia bacterium]